VSIDWEKNHSIEQLLDFADSAMYENKDKRLCSNKKA